MSASSIADIMQDKRALAAACEALAEFLLERADYIKKAAESGAKGFDLAGSLPLMCAFPSPDHMRLMAVRLRAVVRKLAALPVNAEALDSVLSDRDETGFNELEKTIFGNEEGDGSHA